MNKIACVFSFEMSNWISCQKIVFNLHKAYEVNSFTSLVNFNYSVDLDISHIHSLAKEIHEMKPEVVVVLDHKPHPYPLILCLSQLYGGKNLPRFVFHIFGDFTLYYPLWDKLSELLKEASVDFVVASQRQKILFDKFLTPPLTAHVCPFPVNEEEFSYRPELRANQRGAWGVRDDEFIMVFTGRLSRQKRIHTLLQTFAEAVTTIKDEKAHLFLYGLCDHIGDPFVGQWDSEGQYFRSIHRIYKSLPLSIQNRIHFMGNVPNAELASVYQGADFLVNLSVHNDEDFGMSVAEAQASGLPCILTDWGGLAGFEHEQMPEATKYIPVRLGERSKVISTKHVIKSMVEVIEQKAIIDREKISDMALEKFGIHTSHRIIRKILENHPPHFEGFSPFFKKVVAEHLFSQTPYINEKKEIKPIYRDIYSAYVRHP